MSNVSNSPDSPQDGDRPIYRYKRSLEGIVGHCYEDEAVTIVTSALGTAADEYLHAHGYLPGTIRLIQRFFEEPLRNQILCRRLHNTGSLLQRLATYIPSL